MIRGLYTAASGMISKQVQMENLSNNIANVNTPGFKQDKLTFKSFEEYLIANKDKMAGSSNQRNIVGALGFGVGINEIATSFFQGMMEETGRNLDFALEGNGFFTIIDKNNTERYTRDGRFTVNPEGFLTTSLGELVLGIDENGDKTPIRVENPNFQISSQGEIDTPGGKVRLCISDFEDYNSLIKEGANNYRSEGQPMVVDTVVRQNTLEKSNVDTIDIMTEMISIMRSYETNQRIIQQMDDTLGKSVNEVGSIR